MPAGRDCRSCGARLPGDIRWCTTCYEPVRELTARAPLHEGGIVGALRPTGPDQPHWSRWEKSTTTFGPIGRIVMTVGLLASVLLAMSWGGTVYVILFPAVAWVALPAIWAKGWVVPGEVRLPPLPLVERPAPEASRIRTVWRFVGWAVTVAGVWVLAQGPDEAKAAVLAFATASGLVWFFRRFLPT